MKEKRLLLLGWIVLALFLFGMFRFILLRFSSGDMYPFYSSYRSDPLGTKALYESLEICCHFRVERNHEPFSRIKNRFDSAVLVPGLLHQALASVPKSLGEEINYFISNGGRLVITLYQPPRKEVDLAGPAEEIEKKIDLTDVWGIRIFEESMVRGNAYLTEDFKQATSLPEHISSHTPLYFQLVSKGWTTVYRRGERPVIVERKLGRGSVVLSAESYFLSNQAMLQERHPELLAWLVGERASVIFDEYHHGIASQAGVMYLARKYDLEWFLILLAFVALLFIWKNAVSFVPPEKETFESMQSGRESVAALTNLLRRNIPESHVLSASLSEWRKSARNVSEEQWKAMEGIVAAEGAKPFRQRNFAAAYNALSVMLKQRR